MAVHKPLDIENKSHYQDRHIRENDSMYVCNCNAIREKDLRRAARKCGGNAEAVYAAMGKRPNCGTCLFDAEDILAEERQKSFLPAFAVPA